MKPWLARHSTLVIAVYVAVVATVTLILQLHETGAL